MSAITSLALSLIVIAPSAFSGASPNVTDRPNFIVVLCDDLGYGDLSINGHPHIQTPHLDALAEGGILFTDFYSTAPVCSPSRVGLLTGRSPNRAGVYDWIPPTGRPRTDAREQVHLRRDELTIAGLLQDAGYATCMAGKWHCNSAFNRASQPQPGDAGFDHWLATQNNASPRHKDPVNYVRNGTPVGPLEGFSCQIAATEVIEWLRRHRTSSPEQPFFVYLPFHEPHEPVESPEELVQQYRAVARSEDEAQYFANVHNVDLAVGRVIATLRELEITNNTIVVFSSDNGPETLNRYSRANRSWGNTGPLRGMKLHTHDGGFHVAGIVSWPGTIEAGRVDATPVSALDLLPTFSELAGQPVPSGRKLDGTSLVALLQEATPPQREQPLVWAYYNGINHARVAMRHQQWKILARLDGGNLQQMQNLTPELKQKVSEAKLTDFEIYDLSADRGETQNLFGRGVAPDDELVSLLGRHYRELLDDSPTWMPVRQDSTR